MNYTALNLRITEIKDRIALHGRVNFSTCDDSLHLPWSASGFSLRFKGEAVAVSFLELLSTSDPDASENERNIAVLLEIDGVRHKSYVSGCDSVAFADGLADCEHTLRLLKLTESMEPLRVSEVQICGTEPALLCAPAQPTRRIEFIGDSITCGYGIWGARSTFIPFEEDPTSAYAFLSGERLGCDTRLISWSGRGIVRDCEGGLGDRFFEFFVRSERGCGAHDFSLWQPDVVVINGGTNDTSSGIVSDAEFEDGVRELYRLVRSVYPRAEILFFYGAMGQRYDEAYRRVVGELCKSDSSVRYLPTAPLNADEGEMGANGHPSVKCNQRLADELCATLRELFERAGK